MAERKLSLMFDSDTWGISYDYEYIILHWKE